MTVEIGIVEETFHQFPVECVEEHGATALELAGDLPPFDDPLIAAPCPFKFPNASNGPLVGHRHLPQRDIPELTIRLVNGLCDENRAAHLQRRGKPIECS